ncbi:TlpA family protein disulfide reductase [Sphaerisporangium fuscum]|uniref:TlpA family protein disulfide reductase n=1 Tax=Sphaerisporangium fuscum TaxID=2835868 RepID=UPI001BDBF7E3|nr:TlpA disulfide reductase family protein [Sphaerisporangium fuscum]
MRMWRCAGAVLAAVFVTTVAVVLARGLARPSGTPPPLGGRPVELTGTALDGRRFALSRLRGSFVLVNVWASWCEACRAEFPVITEAARRFGPKGLRVLGVDTRDGPVPARVLLRETGAGGYVHLADPDGRLALELGARGVPETFLLDRDGVVVQRVAGPVTWGWVEEALVPRLAS